MTKCANPACSARFRYLHEGKLIVIEPKPDLSMRAPPADSDYLGRSHAPQYFWLCSSCCRAMTVQPDGDHGMNLVRKEEMPAPLSLMDDCTQKAA